MRLFKYTEDQLRAAVKSNISLRQVLLSLGVAPQGGNYEVLRKAIKHFGLDTSHFLGQAANKGKTFTPKRPLEVYLSNEYPIQSNKLRIRLLKEKMFEHKCYSCCLTEWMNKPIPLELEHINGDNKDNSLNNLTLLCPNCHAQTSTYRGRNKSKA